MWSELQGAVCSQLPNPEDNICLVQDNKAWALHCNGWVCFLPARSSSQKLMLLLLVYDGHKWQRDKAQSAHGCRRRQDMADDGSGLGTGGDTTSPSCQPALASAAPAIGRGALQGHKLIIPCRQSYSVTCSLFYCIFDTHWLFTAAL